LFTTVSALPDLQLMFLCSAVRVLTQQQVLNFVLADLEQRGGQGVFILSARITDGMSRQTLVFFGYYRSTGFVQSVPEIGTFSVIRCSGCS
jgi:hypothetical protein